MLYNWQQKDWTKFSHDASKFEAAALEFREFTGQSIGILGSMTSAQQDGSVVNLLVSEAIKTSAIEGEMISRADVISSISLPYTFFSLRLKKSDQCSLTYQIR